MRHPCFVTVIKVDELKPTVIVDVVRGSGEIEGGLLTLYRSDVPGTIPVDSYEVIHEH